MLKSMQKGSQNMKIISDVLDEFLRDARGLGIYALDIGTGSANMALTLAELGIRCITIEKSRIALKQANEIIQSSLVKNKPLLLNMDARKLSFLDDTFEYVIAYKSMHHIENAELALKEMYRVCKPAGRIIIIEHNEKIRNALHLFTKKHGEQHPNQIDISSVLKIMREKEGQSRLVYTEIGTILIFDKKGDKKDHYLKEIQPPIQIGSVDNRNYYYDYKSDKLSYMETQEFTEILIKKIKREIIPTHSLCLNLANQCNLDCKYCYADGGNYGHMESKMSTDVAQKGINWFRKQYDRPFHVILFGGEPLLNKETIGSVLSENDQSLSYSINTNATLLEPEILEDLIRNNVKISISIDGTKKTHNSQRVYKDDSPTYDIIVNKLNKISRTTMQKLWARVTVTNHTNGLYEDIVSLIDMGFTKIDMSFVSGNKDFSETDDLLFVWEKDIDKLAKLSLEKWLNNEVVIYPFVKIFQSLLYGQEAQCTCTAGREMLSLQPDENIVPCFKFIDYPLGTLDQGLDEDKVYEFERYKDTQRTLICEGCWVYKFCGGLCPKDLKTVMYIQDRRCSLIQYLVKCSLLYFSDMYTKKPERFGKQNLQHTMSQWLKLIKVDRNYDKRN
jgi:radical SAM additional 4Fe4S-binding domain